MGHVAEVDTRIRDIDAIKDAGAELGLAIVQDGQARGYGARACAAASMSSA